MKHVSEHQLNLTVIAQMFRKSLTIEQFILDCLSREGSDSEHSPLLTNGEDCL